MRHETPPVLTAPAAAVLPVVRPRPTLTVTVVDLDGQPTTVAGTVEVHARGVETLWPARAELESGIAEFGWRPLAQGKPVEVVAELANGERLLTVGNLAAGINDLELRRGSGSTPLRIRFRDATRAKSIAIVAVEDEHGELQRAGPLDRRFRNVIPHNYRFDGDTMLLTDLPATWRELWLLTRDGHAARIPFATGEVLATWLPESELDLGAVTGTVRFQLAIPTPAGPVWFTVRRTQPGDVLFAPVALDYRFRDAEGGTVDVPRRG